MSKQRTTRPGRLTHYNPHLDTIMAVVGWAFVVCSIAGALFITYKIHFAE